MVVEGGIVTDQVTASLDGLTRTHLGILRATIVKAPVNTFLIEVREAIDVALKAWNDHDRVQAQSLLDPPSSSGLTPDGSSPSLT
jgi:hypothetical protein